jgi:hypothetical protein
METMLAKGLVISSLLLSFSLDEKETKNQGKKMLQPTWPGLARFFADPTHIANGIMIFIISFSFQVS